MLVGGSRAAAQAELARAPYDVLVIGGGIIGAGVANEAARAGLRVALVDRGDFGGATSSSSSNGSRADRIVGLATDRPKLLERVHPDAPDIAAQVVFAAREEWTTSAEDIGQRRTTLAARGLLTSEVIRSIEDLLELSLIG